MEFDQAILQVLQVNAFIYLCAANGFMASQVLNFPDVSFFNPVADQADPDMQEVFKSYILFKTSSNSYKLFSALMHLPLLTNK